MKINIVKTEQNFNDLKRGDIFRYRGSIYLKVGSEKSSVHNVILLYDNSGSKQYQFEVYSFVDDTVEKIGHLEVKDDE